MSYQVSKEDIERVEKVLQDDIRWAVEKGPGWNPDVGTFYDEDFKMWKRSADADECGVCALGAHVLRAQPATVDSARFRTPATVAHRLEVPVEFANDIYVAVTFAWDQRDGMAREVSQRPGYQLGFRLRDFADALVASKEGKTEHK